MALDKHLLELLRCPVSKTALTRLVGKRLEQLNEQINAGAVQYVDGAQVKHPLGEALITEDDKVIYAVDDGIPILLEDQGIGTTQLTGFGD